MRENNDLSLVAKNKILNVFHYQNAMDQFNNGNEEKCTVCHEHFFKLIAEFSDDWVYWINPDSTLGYNSPSCKYITGYDSSNELFYDIHFLEKIIHPQYFESLKRHDSMVDRGINICNEDFAIISKTGEIKWVHHYCQAVYDVEGKYLGRYVCNKDISETKKKQKLFLFNENIVNRICDNGAYGYYQIYLDGKVKNANQTFLEMLGYESLNDLSDVSIEENCLLNPGDRKNFKSNLLKYGFVEEYESEWIRKDWTIVYLSETASIIESMDGDKPYYQGIVEEITKRKLAELANNEARSKQRKFEQLKTEFLATISHEIRTPLNVILNFIQMLKGDYGISLINEKNDIVDIMVEEGERIKRTIDLTLEMSQLQSDTYEYIFTELDLLDDVLNSVCKVYEAKAVKKNLRFDVTNSLKNAKIMADKHSANQIFTQLIDNAVKYTHTGGIDINIFLNGNNQICVEISDTGIGINEEYISHLFSLFSQEDNGYSRMFEGTGLGLAVVKKHCDLNKIQIDVESKKNVGTKFIITFLRDMYDY